MKSRVTTEQPSTAQLSSRGQLGGLCIPLSLTSLSLPGPASTRLSRSPPLAPTSPTAACMVGGQAGIRCRLFSGYSAHRRLRWAWWQWRPHGLKLPFSVSFPFASSTSEGTWALRWSSDLRSAVAGLWARGAHGSQDLGGWQGSLGWTRPWTAPDYPPGCPPGPWCLPAPLRPQAPGQARLPASLGLSKVQNKSHSIEGATPPGIRRLGVRLFCGLIGGENHRSTVHPLSCPLHYSSPGL